MSPCTVQPDVCNLHRLILVLQKHKSYKTHMHISSIGLSKTDSDFNKTIKYQFVVLKNEED